LPGKSGPEAGQFDPNPTLIFHPLSALSHHEKEYDEDEDYEEDYDYDYDYD
jgi:hypothetical protein